MSKIELEISDLNEGTDSPYWIIIDPKQSLRCDPHDIAGMITGPFFSREDAQTHLNSRAYHFSKRAVVYCHSGYWSHQYRQAIKKSKEQIQ